MAWRRSRVQFPLDPRNAAGHRPAVFPFSVLTLSGSNAGSNQQPLIGIPYGILEFDDSPIVNWTLSEGKGVGDIRQLPLTRQIAPAGEALLAALLVGP